MADSEKSSREDMERAQRQLDDATRTRDESTSDLDRSINDAQQNWQEAQADRIMMEHEDIYERENGMLPVSVINKSIDQRMASTIRHNRARGSHDVDLMSNIVKELHELGRSDAWISKHLGMDKDEILRLKQITGLAALFKDIKFGKAWRPVDE